MNSRLIPYLQRLKAWQLTLLIVTFAVVLTEISVASLNLFIRGFIPDFAMLIGFSAGMLVASILTPITIFFLKEIAHQQVQHLETSEQKTRLNLGMAIEAAQMDLWELDLITNAIKYNTARIKIPGFTTDDPPRDLQTWVSTIHPDDIGLFQQHIQQALQPGAANFDLEYRVSQNATQWYWVHTRGGVIQRDATGNPLLAAGSTINVNDRKLAEQHLQQSQDELRTSEQDLNRAQTIAQIGSWHLDIPSNLLRWSDETYRLFGVPVHQAIGLEDFVTAIHPDDRESVHAAWEDALKGATYDIEHRIIANGRTRWVRERAEIKFDTEGHALNGIGTVQDITERKNAEQKLTASQQLLKSIINTVPARIFWKDKESHYLGCNTAFASDAGADSPEAMVGKDDFQFGWKDHAELYRMDDRQVMESGIAKLSFDEPQTTPDGHHIWLRTSKVPLQNEKDEVIGLLGIYEDITERKLVETALHTNEERLRLALSATNQGWFDLNLLTGDIAVSEEYIRILGHDPQDFHTDFNNWISGLHPDDRGEVMQVFRECVETGCSKTMQYRRRKNNGEWIWLSSVGKVVEHDAQGRPSRMIGIHTDITEIKHAEEELRASEARAQTLSNLLRLITDNVSDMIWAKDLNKRYLFANKAICTQLLNAKDTDEPVGKDDMFFAQRERNSRPDDPSWHTFGELCQDSDAVTLQNGAASQFDEHGNVQGKFLFLDVHKAPFINDKGEVIGVVGSGRDVTQQKIIEERLRLASMVLENSSEAMFITDADAFIVDVNPAFTKLTGYTAAEVIGKKPSLLHSGRHEPAFYKAMWKELEKNGHWQGEIWNRRKNGEIFAEWQTINTVYNADGSIHRHVALFSDITEKKKSEELIWAQANFDQLTGLPNRRMFRDRLAQDIKKAHRAGLGLALMFLDLDRFKEVNDSLGHDTGDALLIEAAQRISACVRESDTVARLGGDEFTIILAELDDRASVERIATEILRSLAQPFELGEHTAYVSASIGITMYPDDATSLEDMLKNADQAMYVAKNAGRNRFSYFTNAMQESALYRLHMVNDLRNALAEQQLKLHYQPIVDIHTGKIHKAEALLRWFHPKRGLISPAEFIPLAEESGLIHTIGDWVFEQAVAQSLEWTERYGSDFQISVNKSPLQIQTASERSRWKEHLAKHGLSGKNLVIEITEGVLLDSSPSVFSELLSFRDSGIQVAIDDFGTGYSALSYLKKLDIDYVKIDQSFIHNLESDDSDKALAEAIVVMAHKLGLKVIAEGVETQQQLDLLAQMGCDYAQGFLYSRALAPEDFDRLMKSRQG
jgi:diguanylate cyclase (GGDEF)-like protein/PAS domain S-box-containing protein